MTTFGEVLTNIWRTFGEHLANIWRTQRKMAKIWRTYDEQMAKFWRTFEELLKNNPNEAISIPLASRQALDHAETHS